MDTVKSEPEKVCGIDHHDPNTWGSAGECQVCSGKVCELCGGTGLMPPYYQSDDDCARCLGSGLR